MKRSSMYLDREINIAEILMTILLKAIYIFNSINIRIPIIILLDLEKNNPKVTNTKDPP